VEVSYTKSKDNSKVVIDVMLTNNSQRPAFFINLGLKDPANKTIFPAFWDDNYISLLPGDGRTIRCVFSDNLTIHKDLSLTVGGWNVKEQVFKITL